MTNWIPGVILWTAIIITAVLCHIQAVRQHRIDHFNGFIRAYEAALDRPEALRRFEGLAAMSGPVPDISAASPGHPPGIPEHFEYIRTTSGPHEVHIWQAPEDSS